MFILSFVIQIKYLFKRIIKANHNLIDVNPNGALVIWLWFVLENEVPSEFSTQVDVIHFVRCL